MYGEVLVELAQPIAESWKEEVEKRGGGAERGTLQ
jgi:hypothetical protein